jgi:hypothetical protein
MNYDHAPAAIGADSELQTQALSWPAQHAGALPQAFELASCQSADSGAISRFRGKL